MWPLTIIICLGFSINIFSIDIGQPAPHQLLECYGTKLFKFVALGCPGIVSRLGAQMSCRISLTKSDKVGL